VAKIWTVQDRYGNEIYLTEERWQHIVENHADMEGYLEELRETIRKGHRYQEPIDPRKYRYVKHFKYIYHRR